MEQCPQLLSYASDYTLSQTPAVALHYLQRNVSILLSVNSKPWPTSTTSFTASNTPFPLVSTFPTHLALYHVMPSALGRTSQLFSFLPPCLCFSSSSLFLECSPCLSLDGKLFLIFQSPVHISHLCFRSPSETELLLSVGFLTAFHTHLQPGMSHGVWSWGLCMSGFSTRQALLAELSHTCIFVQSVGAPALRTWSAS